MDVSPINLAIYDVNEWLNTIGLGGTAHQQAAQEIVHGEHANSPETVLELARDISGWLARSGYGNSAHASYLANAIIEVENSL